MLLEKEKVFRDPIHQYIIVDDQFIWELINTRAFQRLNNLHQLGGAYQIFHGATHTRFGHSLGTYAIAREIYEKSPVKMHLSEYERKLVLAAALLHDIGHGPYSHAAEAYLALHHEAMSAKIILEDVQIRRILDAVDGAFAADVVRVLQKAYPNTLVNDIISSQVDADRMDYLLRDSYYAGVPYGDYDKGRIIRIIRVHDDKLVFAETGVHALENFMVSRYHMLRQVYYNAKGCAFESLLKLSVLRFKQLWEQKALTDESIYQAYANFLATNETSDIEAFLRFDDHMFMAVQHLLIDEADEVIATIARAIVERSLPEVFEIDEAGYLELKDKIDTYRESGHPLGFYVDVEREGQPQLQVSQRQGIDLLCKDGVLRSAESHSPILQALQQEAADEKFYVFLHKLLITDNTLSPFEILKLNQF